jgi:hypothetical protein
MKIGVLHGMENSFPPALVQRINDKRVPGLSAEAIRIGCIRTASPSGYEVLVDRISHDVEFYHAYLKNAALTGTVVLNDPFRASQHDQFYAYCWAANAGIHTPRTAMVPQKEHPPGTTVLSLRNLQFPLNWDEIFDYVGFPALVKRVTPGRWKGHAEVRSPEEFFAEYDRSGSAAMMLQQVIDPGEHYRCYVIGDQTRVIRYDPRAAYGERYALDPEPIGGWQNRMALDARALARGLGFEICLAEFVCEAGRPCLVDLVHAAPEADGHALRDGHFEWMVENIAQLAIERAIRGREPQAAESKSIEQELAARA